MRPQTTPKTKASVLVATLMVVGIMLTIALSASVVSLKERKSSLGSVKSNLAFQVADSGIEKVLQLIKDNYSNTAASIDTDGNCNDGIFHSTQGYQVELKDASGDIINNCTAPVSSIKSIKSIGTAGQFQRAIETAVAADKKVVKRSGTDGTCVAFYCADSSQMLSCGVPSYSSGQWRATCCGTDTCLSNTSCSWVFCEI